MSNRESNEPTIPVPLFLGSVYRDEGVNISNIASAVERSRRKKMDGVAESILKRLEPGTKKLPVRKVPIPDGILHVVKTRLLIRSFEEVTRESLTEPRNTPDQKRLAEVEIVSPYGGQANNFRHLGGLTIVGSDTSSVISAISLSRQSVARDEVIETNSGLTDHPEALLFVDFVSSYLDLLD